MSDFSASIIARLDTSRIPGDIKNIEKQKVVLNNFEFDTKRLFSIIQTSLDSHKFRINIDGLQFGNINHEIEKIGLSAKNSFSRSFDIYKDLMSIQRQLNSSNTKLIKLDPSKDILQINELSSQIQRLEGEYKKLYSSARNSLSVEQFKNLDMAINVVADKLTILNAKLQDNSSSRKASSDFHELYDTAKKISSLKINLAGLNEQEDANQISELKIQLNSLEAAYDELRSSLSGKLSTEQLEKLSSVVKETDEKISVLNAKLQDRAKSVSSLDVAILENKTNDWLSKNTAAAEEFGAAIKNAINKLHTLSSNGELTDVDFANIKEEIESIKQEAIKAGKTGNTFSATFTKAFRSILNYVSVSSVIYSAGNAIKEMYHNVVEIDSAMTELKKVTNETDLSYASFLSNAKTSAKEIGATITDYIDSTAYFARLGYSFENAQGLAKVANIYAVVGDEIKNNDEATKSLISTLTAFDIEADKSISIVDKFNEVGKHNMPKDTVMYWDISLLVAISAKLQ